MIGKRSTHEITSDWSNYGFESHGKHAARESPLGRSSLSRFSSHRALVGRLTGLACIARLRHTLSSYLSHFEEGIRNRGVQCR